MESKVESCVESHVVKLASQAAQRRDKYLGYLMSCNQDEFPIMYAQYKKSTKDYKACMHVVDILHTNTQEARTSKVSKVSKGT